MSYGIFLLRAQTTSSYPKRVIRLYEASTSIRSRKVRSVADLPSQRQRLGRRYLLKRIEVIVIMVGSGCLEESLVVWEVVECWGQGIQIRMAEPMAGANGHFGSVYPA